MKNAFKTIGKRLKLVRKQNNLTQSKCAKIFFIEEHTLSRYETGNREPGIEFLENFGNYFQLNANWLLYNKPPIFKDIVDHKKNSLESFLELSTSLEQENQKKTEMPESLKSSLEKLGAGTPEQYITLLSYMLRDPILRQNVLHHFFIVLKPQADERIDVGK
jgi:transcriptional regulator with XRE-family HTH domain